MRRWALLVALGLAASGGCSSFERAEIAQEARTHMVGFSKAQVLACMGAPERTTTEGATETWAYLSGDGHTQAYVIPGSRSLSAHDAAAAQTLCTVQIVIKNGRVARLDYLGPDSGLLSPNAQCAFAVQNCARRHMANS
jgi:hypothetical protein